MNKETALVNFFTFAGCGTISHLQVQQYENSDPKLILYTTEEAWEDDPVHPTTAAYNRIAAATAKINDRMREQEVETKRRRESVGEGGQSLPDARHGRLDSSSSASPSLRGRGWTNRRPRGRGGRFTGGNSSSNTY
jgi:hypothetical protein